MKALRFLFQVFLFIAVVLIPLTAMGEVEKADVQKDRILLKNGMVKRGKIIEVTYDKVKMGGKSIDSSKVSKIVYYDTPSDYIEALELIETAHYDRAFFKLKLALETPGVRKWIKLAVEVKRVKILWLQKKWAEARRLCSEINKNYKDNFFLADIAWKIPISLMKEGKFDNAEVAFDTVYKDSRFSDSPIRWNAWFWKIFTFELRDNNKEAYQQYLKLAQDAYRKIPTPAKTALSLNKPLPDDVKYLGELYLEATFRGYLNMALSGKLVEARKEFVTLSKKASKTLKTVGSVGLAICNVVEIAALEDVDEEAACKLDEARLKLAESLIFSAKTPNRRADLLYWAGRASLLMGDKAQAVSYFEMITEKYPDSLICRSAEKELSVLIKDDKEDDIE